MRRKRRIGMGMTMGARVGTKLGLDHQSESESALLGTGMSVVGLGVDIKAWVFRHGRIGGNGLEHGQDLDLNTQLITSIVN
jgi:hypothetical protein